MKDKSFIGGTIILVTANFISKILGAVLKIPLTYILGEEGMAIYHTTFSVYVTVLFFTTSGIPFAISKYISEELALSREGNVKKAVRLSLVIMSFLGLVGSLILYFNSEFFAYSMKDPKAILPIKAIAPSVFFVAVGCVYKSIYEAFSNMLPTAISQVCEAFIKLALGFTFALWLSSFSMIYAVSGAIFAITTGEVLATLILILLYFPYRRKLANAKASDNYKTVFTAIFQVAVPLMAASVISGCFSLLETSIIRNRLLNIHFSPKSANSFMQMYSGYTDIFNQLPETLKLDIDGARWIFGAFSGYASTVFNLPIGILASFGVTVIPLVIRYVTLGEHKKLDNILNAVMKSIVVLALPCTVIMMIFSEEILFILFKNTASSKMLQMLSPMLAIISLSNIISSTLYASGIILKPFINDMVASILKMILVYFMITVPELNILGVIISSFIANMLALILNFNTAKKHLKISFLSVSFIVKCAVSALSMGIVSSILKRYFLFTGTMKIFICSSILSLAVYFMLVFCFGVITKKEIIKLRS